MHDHPCHCLIYKRNRRISSFSTCFESILTCLSWIITAHVSLEHLEHHSKYFNRQVDRTCQLLQFQSQWPAVPTHLISPLQAELTTINDTYNSCKPTIISAINLLNTDPSFDGHINSNNHCKRILLPFLGDALRLLTGTATTKDVNSIKEQVNQLIEAQSTQQEALVHIVSILNVTRYAAQVNRHSINILMDKVDETSHDVNILYDLTTSLATSLSYHQLVLYIRSVLANLWDSLSYIRMVSTHTMDCIDAAMTGTLSPHILPIMDLNTMLSHIEETLPSTLHLPVSSEDTLHFYWYLCMHVLIANKQFLLIIDVPIQDQTQTLSMYKFSPWIFPMVILQLTMTSILNILELHKKLWNPLKWRNPFMYCNYPQLAVLHHQIFIYPHIMKLHVWKKIYLWIWQIST